MLLKNLPTGYSVVQRLPNDKYARYSHFANIAVKVGDVLIGGKSKIGIMGSTGNSKGPHLDLRISNKPNHSNDPSDYSSPAEYLRICQC